MDDASRVAPYAVAVLALGAGGWTAMLLLIGPGDPAMTGLGLVAFTFGLRHAFDADHIAAIDNATRKLLAEGRPAEGAGFHFSLGHSTVVTLMVLGLAVAEQSVAGRLPWLQQVGGVVGTAVAGAFLYLIAAINIGVFLDAWRAFRARRGKAGGDPALERRLAARGWMNRILGRLATRIRRPTDMYPVGFLFGLGFDTASEVALLAVSAGAASRRVPLGAIMDLPLLFAAGMALADTADGVFMSRAYAWALANPQRRTYYNLAVTGLSILAALAVGTVELAQLAAARLGLTYGPWALLGRVDLAAVGAALAALLALTWAVAYAAARLRRSVRRRGGPLRPEG